MRTRDAKRRLARGLVPSLVLPILLAAIQARAQDELPEPDWTREPTPSVAPDPDEAPTIDEIRRQLEATLERVQRHEEELRALKAALDETPAEGAAGEEPIPETLPAAPAEETEKTEAWYDRIKIRGYTQIRYNTRGGVHNENLINEQGDRSIGGNGGFLIRRARVILFGEIHPQLSIYLQPDFASVIGEQLGVTILRDWYADVFLDEEKEFRIRVGQSKVPFGFENLQSSQNRLPLDRNDALNSAVKDERDLGAFLYWAPDHIRKRFKHILDSGLKGSGDYGVIGLGVYNGQTANRLELNESPHAIFRATWPFLMGRQFLEIGGGGYYGQYTVKVEDKEETEFTSTNPDNTFHDGRGHLSFILYPQPFGLAMEYTVGVGPQLGRDEPTVVDDRLLYGGYLQLMLKIDEPFDTVALIPYVRGTMYDGGKKFVTNAPRYQVRELEMGLEWQIMKPLEVVAAYMISDRTSDRFPYEQQYGHVTRLQVQFNYW
jgi:hypothetical protein